MALTAEARVDTTGLFTVFHTSTLCESDAVLRFLVCPRNQLQFVTGPSLMGTSHFQIKAMDKRATLAILEIENHDNGGLD